MNDSETWRSDDHTVDLGAFRTMYGVPRNGRYTVRGTEHGGF